MDSFSIAGNEEKLYDHGLFVSAIFLLVVLLEVANFSMGSWNGSSGKLIYFKDDEIMTLSNSMS